MLHAGSSIQSKTGGSRDTKQILTGVFTNSMAGQGWIKGQLQFTSELYLAQSEG